MPTSSIDWDPSVLPLPGLCQIVQSTDTKRIPGQNLDGDMIPRVKGDNFTVAPIGRAALHTNKLAKNAPGARGAMINNSRILAAIAVAVLVTYYGTPMIASVFSKSPEL